MTRRIIRIAGRIFLASIAALILLVAGGYGFLQTDQGRAFLVSQVETAANGVDGLNLDINGLSGNVFGTFQVGEILVTDLDGKWLTVHDLTVSWSPLDLLQGTARFHQISSEAVTVFRQPNMPETPETETGSEGFSLPFRLSLAQFSIDQLDLKEEVLGRRGVLQVSMDLNSKTDTSLTSELKVRPVDGQGGFVQGEVLYSLSTTRFGVSAELDGPAGGLISRILGLPGYPPVTATIIGDGPLDRWQGQVTVDVKEMLSGDLLILSEGAFPLNVEISGGVRVSKELAKNVPLIDDNRITINADLAVDQAQNLLTIRSAVIENATIKTDITGTVDLERLSTISTLTADLKKVDGVNALIAPVTIGGLFGTVQLNGDLSSMGIKAKAQLIDSQLTTGDDTAPTTIQNIDLKATSDISLNELNKVPFDGELTLSGLAGLPAPATEVIGSKVSLTSQGFYALTENAVNFQKLTLLSQLLQMQAAGQLYLEKGPSQLTATASMTNLNALLPSAKGTVKVTSQFNSKNLSQDLQGQLDVEVSKFDLGQPDLQELLGTNLNLGVSLSLKDDLLTVEGDLPLKTARVTARAELPTTFDTILADIHADFPKLDPFSKLAGVTLAGSSLLNADIRGALTDPDVEGTINVKSLNLDQYEIGDANVDVTAAAIVSSLRGTIEGAFLEPLLDLQFGAEYDLADGKNLKIENFQITQQDNRINGDMVIPLSGQPVSGNLKAALSNFKSLALISDIPLTGALDAVAQLDGSDGEQRVQLDVTGQDLSAGDELPSVKTLKLDLTADKVLSKPEIDTNLTADRIEMSGAPIANASVVVNGGLEQARFNFKADSEMELPFDISGEGRTQITGSETVISLATFTGHVADRKITLQSPLKVVQANQDLRIDPFAISLGSGQIEGHAEILQNQVRANLAVQSLPVDLLNIVYPDTPMAGTLNANAALDVTSERSEGTFSARLVDVVLTDADFQDLPALNSELTATLAGGDLKFEGNVSGLTATSILVSGEIPMDIGMSPFSAAIPDQSPLDVAIDVNSNLDKLWPLLGIDQHLLNGTLMAKGNLGGTLDAPKINGKVELKNGRYEEIVLGTIIERLQLTATVEQDDKVIIAASGQDGEAGSLKLDGVVNLADLNNPEIDMTAALREMAVLRQDALSVVTDADISLRGDLTSMAAEGVITTRNVEVDIGGAVAPSVVELPVTEVNFPEGHGSGDDAEASKMPLNITLAIDIDMPRRVFIRGRGLDSEWEGNFQVKGTADTPLISGELSPVRGQFTFAGKEFQLQKGLIALQGKADIDPELSLSAKYEGTNVTAIVSIEGNASNPEINFSSPNNLPEDEILARVLFGKSAAKLSALEAVQLAQAVGEVSGTFGGGGGIMGFARETLGVDVLSAGVNENTGDAEVSAGKYITDNIYVGVAQGATAGSTAARVEIELTPNISVESETDQTTNSSVGVFWKWDY